MDFSKITTHKLRYAVNHAFIGSRWFSNICSGVSCSNCPYISLVCSDHVDEIRAGFKTELERREKPTMTKTDEELTAQEFAEKYKGKKATNGPKTGIISAYSDNNILLTGVDGGWDATVYDMGDQESDHEVVLPWEGSKKCWWAQKQELTILDSDLSLNEMPILEAGMVVDISYSSIGKQTYLVINKDYGININTDYYSSLINTTSSPIVAVYKLTDKCAFSSIKDNLELIWELTPPKTEEELKLEELEQTVETALAQIKEIKGDK